MPNILKASQPINPGFDNNTIYNNPIRSGDQKIQNIVDPSQIIRPDGKTEGEDARFQFNTGSNFEGFVNMLKDVPQMSELLTKFIFLDAESMISAGLSENFAAEISRFMEMMKMDEGELLNFIKDQSIDSSQMGGVFFQALKEVLNQTGSVDLKAGILDFIKKYNDLASSGHLLDTIEIQARAMIPFMFKEDGMALEQLLTHLLRMPSETVEQQGTAYLDAQQALIEQNGKALKEEFLPFFNQYINKTHDMGKVRSLITFFTLNTARYVNGEPKGVMQSFERLLSFNDFNRKFTGLGKENMTLILNNLLTQKKIGENSAWADKFLNLVRLGVNGEGGYESRAAFANIMNAMLLNESVYMPLIHLMLPVNIDGNLMFSELWIDPDAREEPNSQEGEKRTIRVMVKFDIKDLGFFDVIMDYRDGEVDLQVYYPERLAPMEREIKNGMGEIVARNGLSARNLVMGKCVKPRQLMEVFPKLSEGRNSVNVRV